MLPAAGMTIVAKTNVVTSNTTENGN